MLCDRIIAVGFVFHAIVVHKSKSSETLKRNL